VAAAFLVLLSATPAFAVNPDERLDDPALEARARAISQELRCLVCQNQSIDDSNADLAHDLRMLVRDRLKAGDSDAAVIQYLRVRYGDYVMLKPPLERATWLLWFGPFAALAVAAGTILLLRRRGPAPALRPLDAAEEARLARLLEEDAP
jgi:cytochrome c-type biogenesis protein CcmH